MKVVIAKVYVYRAPCPFNVDVGQAFVSQSLWEVIQSFLQISNQLLGFWFILLRITIYTDQEVNIFYVTDTRILRIRTRQT